MSEEDQDRWATPIDDEDEEQIPEQIPEELLVSLEEDEEDEAVEDLSHLEVLDTQHDDGHTYNIHHSLDQGLTYTPPDDPPTLPGEDRQGADMAAGFGVSMEDQNVDVENLPGRVDNNDLDLEDDVREALRLNSETQTLDDVRVRTRNGVVALFGKVPTDTDLALVDELISSLEGVTDVQNYLEVEDEDDEGLGPEEE